MVDQKQKREVLDILYMGDALGLSFLSVGALEDWFCHVKGIDFKIEVNWLAGLCMSDPDSTEKVPLLRVDPVAVERECLAHSMGQNNSMAIVTKDKAKVGPHSLLGRIGWRPNSNKDLFEDLERAWTASKREERIKYLLHTEKIKDALQQSLDVSMGCKVAEPICSICGETGPHAQHYSLKMMPEVTNVPIQAGAISEEALTRLALEQKQWEDMIFSGFGLMEGPGPHGESWHRLYDHDWIKLSKEELEQGLKRIRERGVLRRISDGRVMCWRCASIGGPETVHKNCSCGGWFVHGPGRYEWEQLLYQYQSAERALCCAGIATPGEHRLMPMLVPVGFDVRIVKVRDEALDRAESEQYVGELATVVEVPLQFKLQIGTRLYYAGSLDPTRWSTAQPRHFDHVEIELIPENRGMGNSAETQIVNILDEIDDRLTSSQFIGPDPLQIVAERARLALAEVEYDKIVETHEHEIRSVLEDMTGLPRLFLNPDRVARWERAGQFWEYIEEVCAPNHAKRDLVTLRAARLCLISIKNLPHYRH